MAYIKNLNYKIDNFSLVIPSLEIKDQKINVIMGPSGSGKTTLFNLISGFIPYTDWVFEVAGVDIAKKEISERHLGIVFQSHELFPHLTAEENVELVMQSRKNTNAEAYEHLQKYKTLLQLDTCWKTQAQVLSGGEKQRVSFLRALMSKPQLLLLDEPFSALDEANKIEARALLKQALAISQVTVLMISHDPVDAEVFGPHIIRLKHGQIV